MRKKYNRQVISIEFIKTRKHNLQACHKKGKARFTSHAGLSLIFSMFINLLIKLFLTFIFHFIHFISFTINWFNKIDIVICNVDRYGDMD